MAFRYRALAPDGDMQFGQGRANFYIDDSAAVPQAIQTRLGLWTGEWFLNLDDGTDWRQIVGVVGAINVRDAILRQRILGTPFVKSLYDWSVRVDQRVLTASGKVVTAFGISALVIQAQPGAMPEIGWGGFPVSL